MTALWFLQVSTLLKDVWQKCHANEHMAKLSYMCTYGKAIIHMYVWQNCHTHKYMAKWLYTCTYGKAVIYMYIWQRNHTNEHIAKWPYTCIFGNTFMHINMERLLYTWMYGNVVTHIYMTKLSHTHVWQICCTCVGKLSYNAHMTQQLCTCTCDRTVTHMQYDKAAMRMCSWQSCHAHKHMAELPCTLQVSYLTDFQCKKSFISEKIYVKTNSLTLFKIPIS